MPAAVERTIVAVLALAACRTAEVQNPAAPAPSGTPHQLPSATLPVEPGSSPEPAPSPSPTPCAESAGQVIESSYRAVAVAADVPLLVYLPPCYGEGTVGYPTAYLLHGLPYDERHWLELGAVEQFELGLRAGVWEPMILVMPRQPEPLFTSTDGGPGSYEQEFLEALVAHVERAYAVDPARQGVAGISRGAIWALEIAFRNPQRMVAVAALSPALAVNAARPAYDPLELARASPQLPAAILLLAGESDWAAVKTADLSQILLERDIGHQHLQVPGDHSDPTWAAALDQVFDFLSASLSRP